MDRRAAGGGEGGRHRLLHDDSPRPRRTFRRRAVLGRVPGRARRSRGAAARSRAADDAADAEGLPHQPRRRVHLERLLRQRCRVDGARRLDRADDRAVRGLRRRVVQLQGGVRSLHHRARRRRNEEAASFGAELQGLENALPIDPSLRNPKLGALAPIRVVNVVFTAGDANRGVQTAAFNLPNDERVVKDKGTKRVMLKNVQEAKFQMVLLPISKVALPAAQQAQRLVRRLLHAHPDARADARPRPAQHRRRRPRRRRSGRSSRKRTAPSRKPRPTSRGCGR